ncbi:hypothetical protein AAGS61_06950 [Lysinibacillus sp. KU-BSD001]|uniref:hypothetical protein n=1 Tax=Lysinibacillus sp. KU-BSD001 TaxID=3141328 RepID=UPI0036ED3EF8
MPVESEPNGAESNGYPNGNIFQGLLILSYSKNLCNSNLHIAVTAVMKKDDHLQ